MSKKNRPCTEPVVDAPHLTDAVVLLAPEHEQPMSREDLRRNMACNVMLDSTWAVGWTDMQMVLQPFLVFLAASNSTIGLVAGASITSLVGIFLTPWITRRFRHKKWLLMGSNTSFLTVVLGMALLAVLGPRFGMSNPTLLNMVVALSLVSMLFGGFAAVPAQEFLAACIPMNYRGRLVGYSGTIAGIASFGAGALAYWVLQNVSKPASFGVVMLMGWFICQAGVSVAIFSRERPTPVENSPKPWSTKMFRAAWHDKPYMRALILCWLYSLLIVPVFPFVNVYGFKKLGMVAAMAAVIQIVTQVVKLSVSAPSGHLTDKLTPKRVMPPLFLLGGLALLPALFIQSQLGVFISVGLSALFSTAIFPAMVILQYSLPSPENRAGHYSIQLILNTFAFALGPMIYGVILDFVSYRIVFGAVAILSAAFWPFAKWMLAPLPDDVKCYS